MMRSAIILLFAIFAFANPNNNETDITREDIDALRRATGIDDLMTESLKTALSFTDNKRCIVNALIDTFKKSYSRQFEMRNSSDVFFAYLQSFTSSERGQGKLNERGLGGFASLGEEHLIKRFSEIVAMSYCDKESDISHLAKLNLRVGEFEILKIGNDVNGKLMYYTTFNPKTKVMTYAFRGTDSKNDYLIDLLAAPVPVNQSVMILPGVSDYASYQVHLGFWTRMVEYRERVTAVYRESIEMIRLKYKTDSVSVVMVGHSLGAAWCFLQGLDWALTGVHFDAMYVYGMPIVGNDAFGTISAQIIGNKVLRIVNEDDLIPHVGYAPKGKHPLNITEYFVPVGEIYIKRCKGGQDPTCSLSVPCMKWSWDHHSELAGMSLRDDFCRNVYVTPDNVYAAVPEANIVLPPPVQPPMNGTRSKNGNK